MAEGTGQQRARRTTGGGDELAALRSRRDELDARDADRRQREDAALARYAAAIGKARQTVEAAETKAATLERRAADLRDQARTTAAEQDSEQAAALVELHALGRSADDLAAMTGIPVKKLRIMIRSGKPSVSSTRQPSPVDQTSTPTPAATPEDADS